MEDRCNQNKHEKEKKTRVNEEAVATAAPSFIIIVMLYHKLLVDRIRKVTRLFHQHHNNRYLYKCE